MPTPRSEAAEVFPVSGRETAIAEFAKRPILHVDMDAFYAAIEQHDRPDLLGKPVVVGAPPDRRGVVSTASYEARRFGVHSAMPSRTAGRLCPHAVFLPVRMERYREVSRRVMEILRSFTPVIEQVSIDEAFLDVRGSEGRWRSPIEMARRIKKRIRDRTGLTASVGVAPNKFLAKLAGDLQKPDGLTVAPVDPEAICRFLAPLPVTRLWGVGPALARRLAALGIRTVGQLQRCEVARLVRGLGPAAGLHLQRLARGEDSRNVVTAREEKSISNETTFPVDCGDPERVRQTLLELVEKVGRRLRSSGKLARTGQLKLRYADFRTLTRQTALGDAPTNSDRRLLQCAFELLDKTPLSEAVRLVGFGVHGLEDEDRGMQPSLFEAGDLSLPRQTEARLDRAVDRLRERFGPDILRRGDWRRRPQSGEL
ncbi:MAG: DNA polymerase IV [Kiritimatiellaeota bacterium]|nr:DNA polymerase IV [Kiritimatiellota bacterium]